MGVDEFLPIVPVGRDGFVEPLRGPAGSISGLDEGGFTGLDVTEPLTQARERFVAAPAEPGLRFFLLLGCAGSGGFDVMGPDFAVDVRGEDSAISGDEKRGDFGQALL